MEAIGLFFHFNALVLQLARQRADPVGFLVAQLGGVADHGLAARKGGGDPEDREFIDHLHHARPADRSAVQGAGLHPQVAGRLAGCLARVQNLDLAAHLAQDAQQAGAGRVQAHIP